VDGSDEYEEKCHPSYFCDEANGVSWHIDWESPYSLNNWMTHFELYCSGKMVISGAPMSCFLGFAVGVLLLPSLSDRYGRKKYFLLCFLVQELCIFPALFFPKSEVYMYVIIAMCFVFGIFLGGRAVIGYCMMLDFSPKKYHSYLGTGWNVADGLILIWETIYYSHISKDWKWL